MRHTLLCLVLIFSMTTLTYAGLGDGLVGYYPFDGNLNDYSGSTNVNDATAVGTPDLTPDGLFGKSVEVGDAGASYVSLGTPSDYLFGDSTSFTFTYWLRVPDWISSDPTIVGNKNWSSSGGAQGFVQAILGDDVKANIADGSTRADTSTIDLDHDAYWDGQGKASDDPIRWTFVAMTVDRTSNVLTNYVMDGWVINQWDDGSTPTTTSISSVGSLDSGFPTNIGQDGDGGGYTQLTTKVDDMGVWRRALTLNEIWGIYTAGRFEGKSLSDQLYGATNPDPGNGDTLVPIAKILSWSAPVTITPTGYDVYFDPNETLVADGDVSVRKINDQLVTTYNPGGMDFNTQYYWRVDPIVTPLGEDPNVYPGGVWTFRTTPEIPTITTQPASLTKKLGQSASFTVVATNATGYQWYKDEVQMLGKTSATLTIDSVILGDEGYYTCEVSNAADMVTSAAAQLLTERLISHWTFENTLNDIEGGWNGTYIDPNEGAPTPTPVYDTGVNGIGQAIVLPEDSKYILIPDSNDYFNFYPQGYTVNAWAKTTKTSAWGAVAAKQDRVAYFGWVLNINGVSGVSTLREETAGNFWPDYAGTTTVTDGEWHMLTGQFDPIGRVVRIYIDGELENTSGQAPDPISTNVNPLVLGVETSAGEIDFEGLIDEVQIYSYALDPYAVAHLYTDIITDAEICVEDVSIDYNGDCKQDLRDFAIFVSHWLECNIVPTCIN